jgi:hypothetical protein
MANQADGLHLHPINLSSPTRTSGHCPDSSSPASSAPQRDLHPTTFSSMPAVTAAQVGGSRKTIKRIIERILILSSVYTR